MAIKLLREYILGDIIAKYLIEESSGQVSLRLLPSDKYPENNIVKNEKLESLVQLKITGDIYDCAYAMGNTMRNSETVKRLVYKEQEIEKADEYLTINTVLLDDRGYRVTHHLIWKYKTPYIKIYCTFENQSEEVVSLEMMESFSISGLSPYLEGDGHENLYLHRIRGVWSQEGRHEYLPVEDLQLEPAYSPHAVRCERFGQVGSMPVNKFFPFVAIEDRKNNVFWGAQIAHNASWQMEVYRKDDGLSISGGLADREFGHWMKEIKPKETFDTPYAIVTTANTESFDELTGRLTQYALEHLDKVPDIEKDLPLVFNEYCTTWGNPSHENITEILENIKGKGFSYFVIDCGWFKEDGIPWDISMGDYEVSKSLFPEGLDKTVKVIKDADMIPGIWFEIENVGSASKAYKMEDYLLHKDGKVLTSYFRRFWDMKNPWVENYLTDRVIGTLNKYGFGYMKIDYNETIGIGCEGAESLGEGLRKNMEASYKFIDKVKNEVPNIVLENCASGGHRLEPSLMAQMSMASFSDAHECKDIPIIAANLHRVIHPAQSQIWAVIRTDDSLKRIAYSMANTFLGRLCLSGDVTKLTKDQWILIEKGIKFYKSISEIIKNGQSYLYGSKIKSTRYPKGWQALLRIGKNNEAYIVIHTFEAEIPECISIELKKGYPKKIKEIYSDTEENVVIENNVLKYYPKENYKALAIKLV
ncbi:alpha-galactosidase [Clostridium sp. AL.422]|uniref:glycoside hydrolase family 36 protein n=1 Tax=Clostridium TaxID=1485 RepID=UPI00293DDB77|nr:MULTISPECIES: alpha-galactosidase [unclassified Clostridium]MDV4149393.1 alpha-galactosidase [Clostridium sp. AL.422]